jgi:hypothetical protein
VNSDFHEFRKLVEDVMRFPSADFGNFQCLCIYQNLQIVISANKNRNALPIVCMVYGNICVIL